MGRSRKWEIITSCFLKLLDVLPGDVRPRSGFLYLVRRVAPGYRESLARNRQGPAGMAAGIVLLVSSVFHF
jgi:hypothetical protein